MAAPEPSAQEMPQMPSMMPMLIMMVIMFGLYALDGENHTIGVLLNYVFGVLDFSGQYPVVTLMLVGAIMAGLTTLLRSLTTDMIEQAKSQQIMSAFNQEFRQARLDNNLYKVKKLTELQPVMMAKNMESSNKMMKMMPYTMIIIVPMFLWVRYFVDVTLASNAIIAIPWALGGVSLQANLVLPVWILIYSLISIPFGQILGRIIRGYQFKKRLKELDSEYVEVEEVA